MDDHLLRGSFLRLVHIERLEANGPHEEARAALVSARDRLVSMVETIVDAAYQTSFLENVPEKRRTLELAREWLRIGVSARRR